MFRADIPSNAPFRQTVILGKIVSDALRILTVTRICGTRVQTGTVLTKPFNQPMKSDRNTSML